MKNIILIFIYIFILPGFLSGQEYNFVIIVKDKATYEPIANCVIGIMPGNTTTTTDTNGKTLLRVESGTWQIHTRALGYEEKITTIKISSDTTHQILLNQVVFNIKQVTVISDSVSAFGKAKYGNYSVNALTIRQMPNQFSEPDLIKAFHLLPGVTSGREGSSELFIRGGTSGQNIAYSNGASYILPNHLMGTVSPYDSDFLEHAELLKNHIPAQYGGGASSVMSLEYRRSKMDSLSGQLRFGILSSGGIIDLPLNNKTGVVAGAKTSNYWIYKPILKLALKKVLQDFTIPSKYTYQNAFIKLNHETLNKGEIAYLLQVNNDLGKQLNDQDGTWNDTKVINIEGIDNGWRNIVHSLSWSFNSSHRLKPVININYSSLSVKRDIYDEKTIISDSEETESEMNSLSFSPINRKLEAKICYEDTQSFLNFGLSYSIKTSNLRIDYTYLQNDLTQHNLWREKYLINQPTLFVSYDKEVFSKLEINAGIRASLLIVDHDIYFIPEPRIRAGYKVSKELEINLTYNKFVQPDHYIEGSSAGLRTSLWLPVTSEFGPMTSDVLSIDLSGDVGKGYSYEISGYYKFMNDMLDLVPGASFLRQEPIYDKLEQVKGEAYGIEAGIMKRKGKLQGLISYTYSRSKREWFAPEGTIMIPSTADRPHNIALSSCYNINSKHSIRLNWFYRTGMPATMAIHWTTIGDFTFFKSKNNIRFRDYHCLNLAYRYTRKGNRFNTIFDFDLTNVYNRRNTYYIGLVWDSNFGKGFQREISLFPIMPSVTLTLEY